ncbi:MAG: hypothetical protein QNK20_11900 [Aureibaculum sp.]|nr:hypothetical protein [Aureibaculum sp.]
MKRRMTKLISFTILMILILSSCRDEVTIDIPGTNEPALKANTTLAGLMQRTSLKDGSKDNIIDYANCLSIELPVEVIANGQEITVNNEDDYDLIEDIFDEFDNDTDEIVIIFPINVILGNFNEMVITNQDDFNNFRNGCNGENEHDEDIECLDFQYPINASIFNTTTEQTKRITINNDKDMHDFIEELDEDDVANITFPVMVTLFDGTEITITSLDQLENEIESAEDDCDEDDDYDYNDDDCMHCTQEQILDVLTNCSDWKVDKLKLNGNELQENYVDYIFNFSNDGTLMVQNNSISYPGTWSSTGMGNNIIVILDIPDLSDFNASWRLHEIEESVDEKEVELRLGEDRLGFESNCN